MSCGRVARLMSFLRRACSSASRHDDVIAQGDELGVRAEVLGGLPLRLLDSVFLLKAQDETAQSMRIRLRTLLAGKVAVHRSTAFLRALALLASTPCVCVSNDTGASEPRFDYLLRFPRHGRQEERLQLRRWFSSDLRIQILRMSESRRKST